MNEFGEKALTLVLAILIPVKICEYLAKWIAPVYGFVLGGALFVYGIKNIGHPDPDDKLALILILGAFLGGLIGMLAANKERNNVGGRWFRERKPRPPKPAPVVAAPPPPPPAPVPQTVIHYTDNRDQSIRIDNSVHVTVGAMTPEAARALFGLPMHFTRQRLENTYEEKIRLLDSQAQALPRGDQQSRLLISQKEDQLEQAYKVLRG